MSPIKVLVVDDHALFRRGIVEILAEQENLEVVGEASDGLEAIEKAHKTAPDIIVMDLMMPHCSGLEAIEALQAEMPQINVLVLTVSDKEDDLFSAIKFGARGYILKNTSPEELVAGIFYVAQGGVLVSPLMATKLLDEFKGLSGTPEKEPAQESGASISPREAEVLQLLAQGATNKQIAQSLFVSENTVKTHLRSILEKLHLANRSQAAAYAVKKGLIKQKE